jgi:hypothetical protein
MITRAMRSTSIFTRSPRTECPSVAPVPFVPPH